MRCTGYLGGVVLCLLLAVATAARASHQLADADPREFRQIINHAKEQVFPAVVFIKCVAENFEGGRRIAREVSGSGVLISPDGELLTNWHVIDQAVEVRCLLFDGRAFEAEVIGSDRQTDLALLKLRLPEGSEAVPYARIKQTDNFREGDFVMAMGAPWGLSRSVSIGIVSCARRYLPDSSEYSLWLQTDASISPGNSGGPLVDTDGEIVGINTLGAIIGGDMGFAIPTLTLRELLPHLREHGRVEWSWTGLKLQPIRDFNRNMYFGGTEGVIVADVEPDSPAREAGLRTRDRILRINGQSVVGLMDEDLPDIRRMLGLLPRHEPAQLQVQRGDQLLELAMTPRSKGDLGGETLDCPRWDFTVKPINQFDNPDLFFHRREGVFVYGVRQPGNAAMASLQPQDILLRVGGQEVRTLEDVRQLHADALRNINENHRVVLTVLRNGLMRQVVLDYSRDFTKR